MSLLQFYGAAAAVAFTLLLVAVLLVVLTQPRDPQPVWRPAALPPGRHRLDAAVVPFRDWAAIAAERMNEEVRRKYAPVVIAGLDTWDADTERITLWPADDETATLQPVS